MSDTSSSGFPFSISSVLSSIVGDAASKYGGFIIGDLVKAILAGTSTSSEILKDVETMETQLSAIKTELNQIESEIQTDMTEIKTLLSAMSVYQDVTTQEAVLGDDIASIQTQVASYYANISASANGSDKDLKTFCDAVRDGSNPLAANITAIGNAMIDSTGGTKGLLNSWTRLYIAYLADAPGTTLTWAFDTLSSNFLRYVWLQIQGVVVAYNAAMASKDGDTLAKTYLASFTDSLDAQVAAFVEAVEVLVLSQFTTDFSNIEVDADGFSDTSGAYIAPVLPDGASTVFATADLIAADMLQQTAGLRGRIFLVDGDAAIPLNPAGSASTQYTTSSGTKIDQPAPMTYFSDRFKSVRLTQAASGGAWSIRSNADSDIVIYRYAFDWPKDGGVTAGTVLPWTACTGTTVTETVTPDYYSTTSYAKVASSSDGVLYGNFTDASALTTCPFLQWSQGTHGFALRLDTAADNPNGRVVDGIAYGDVDVDAGEDTLPTGDGDALGTKIKMDVTGHYPDNSSDFTYVQLKNCDYFNRIVQVSGFDAKDAGTPFVYLIAGRYSDKYIAKTSQQNAQYPFVYGREVRFHVDGGGASTAYAATVSASDYGSKDVVWKPAGLTVGAADSGASKSPSIGSKIDIAVTGTGVDNRDFGYGYAPQLMDLSFSLKAFWIAWPMPSLQTT